MWNPSYIFAALMACLLGLSSAGAFAGTAEELLMLLYKKGVITEEEYKILNAGHDKQAPAQAEPKPAAKAAPEAKAEASAPAKDEIVAKFKDGITWESADKGTVLGINGRIQADFRKFFGADVLDADTFDVRRAYLGARGKFWNDYEFQVVGDFGSLSGPTATVCTNAACTSTASVPTSTSSHLDEAYFNITWWKQARFRFGQFDMPFSLETLMSDRFTDFMERSMASTSLAQGKARGAMVYGVPVTGVYYGLAYSNGQGKNTNDTNQVADGKQVTGRVAVNWAELFSLRNSVYHVGGAFSTGKIPASAAPSGRTDARGITFFAPAPFTGGEVDRTRYGLETAVAYGPYKLQAEYVRANFSGTSAGGAGYNKDIRSYYIDLNWLITGEHYADAYSGGVFGRIRPKSNFAPSGGGWGAWEASVRYTTWDASDFSLLAIDSANPGTGVLIPTSTFTPTNEAKGYTLGLKWILNPNTRFLLNYTKTDFASPVRITSSSPSASATTGDERAITFRGQFDF